MITLKVGIMLQRQHTRMIGSFIAIIRYLFSLTSKGGQVIQIGIKPILYLKLGNGDKRQPCNLKQHDNIVEHVLKRHERQLMAHVNVVCSANSLSQVSASPMLLCKVHCRHNLITNNDETATLCEHFSFKIKANQLQYMICPTYLVISLSCHTITLSGKSKGVPGQTKFNGTLDKV